MHFRLHTPTRKVVGLFQAAENDSDEKRNEVLTHGITEAWQIAKSMARLRSPASLGSPFPLRRRHAPCCCDPPPSALPSCASSPLRNSFCRRALKPVEMRTFCQP